MKVAESYDNQRGPHGPLLHSVISSLPVPVQLLTNCLFLIKYPNQIFYASIPRSLLDLATNLVIASGSSGSF